MSATNTDRLTAMCQLGLDPARLRHLVWTERATRSATNPGSDALMATFGFCSWDEFSEAVEEVAALSEAKRNLYMRDADLFRKVTETNEPQKAVTI